jgi:hypothetical protein
MPAATAALPGWLRAAVTPGAPVHRLRTGQWPWDSHVTQLRTMLANTAALAENWDGRGSPAPDPRALDAAGRMVETAHRSWHLDLSSFALGPAAGNAGVLVEALVGDLSLALIFDPGGEHGYFVADNTRTDELVEGVASIDASARDFWERGRLPWHAASPGDLACAPPRRT